MRRLTLLIVFWIICFCARSQTYGNEWINYSQQYYKLPVYREGIYRIDSATLSNYFDLNLINPKNFQLFIKGKEQFLYIKGEADNKINTGDFIEFYADGNVAPVDSALYYNIGYLPNPYKSLFNDSLFAFITLNSSASNKRFTLETDTTAANYPAAQYAWNEIVYSSRDYYNEVAEFENGTSDPVYTQAEGRGFRIYEKPDESPPQKSWINAFTLNTYTANPALNASLSYNGSGYFQSGQTLDHRLKVFYTDAGGNAIQLTDTMFRGFKPFRRTFAINPQNLGNSSTVTFSPSASSQFVSTSNVFDINFVRLFYPQTLNLAGKTFYKLRLDEATSATKGFYNFSNFNFGGSTVELLDLTNGRYIETKTLQGMLRAVVPNSGGRKLCVLMRRDSVFAVTSLKKVNPNGFFTDLKTGGSKPFVIIYNNQLKTSATNYRNYRQSVEGGSYDVVFADVNALYEQFGYGVNQHPIAIRNFLRYLKDKQAAAPKYVLLIGHGIRANEANYNGVYYSENLLPAMGVPSSDNLLTSALTGTNPYVPEIPIGRVAGLSNKVVNDYLEKVKQHDQSGDASWKKNVLHFVGGDDGDLLKTLSNYMNNYAGIIRDTLYGAKVTTFKKNTTAPIQTNISDSVFRIIGEGCSILTFFGHGSLTGFDQAIDDPSKYNNPGKYPFLIANSCNSGDIFYPGTRSASENFVFAQQEGSIGFIATTSFGLDLFLYEYTVELYKALGASRYGQGLGDAVQEACANTSARGLQQKFVSLDMALHGDPSLRLWVGNAPDYVLANTDISFDLKKHVDSIGISINLKNTGIARKGNFSVRVSRYFPNGDSSIIYKTVKAPHYRDTLAFYIPLDFSRGIGLNHFAVAVDNFNQFAEKSESNNATIGTVDLFIPGGDIYPVYPYKYAIVPKTPGITLRASTTDPFAPSTTYRLQLDTCDKFTSTLQSTLVTSKGGVIEWNVNLPLPDSTVYFWRVSRDSTGPLAPFAWHESSFQTIGGRRGWGQAHFNQFKSDGYRFVNYLKDQRKFGFNNSVVSILCRNGINPYYPPYDISFFMNSIRMSAWGCSADGWNIAVFDSISGEPKRIGSTQAIYGPDSNCICATSLPYYSFGYVTGCNPVIDSTWQRNLEKFLKAVPPNNYVLAFTIGQIRTGYARTSSYSNSLYQAFESIGAKNLSITPDTVAYILFGRKGMIAGQGHEVIAKQKKVDITLEDSIRTKWRSGHIASEKIGPSQKWNSLHWRVKSVDSGSGDTTVLKLVGIGANGGIDTLATFKQDSSDINNLWLYADAAQYPYLQLVAFMRDTKYSTSPQLKRWQVLYDEAPECAINPLKGFASVNDTVQEGGEVSFRFPIENIGVKNFEDTLAITYWVEDARHNKITLADKLKAPPFTPGQVIIDTLNVNSYQLQGHNAVWVNVNPLSHKHYQHEQYLFNNIGRYSFKVDGDVTNPLLDVTFDGVRILNGDIVSSRPTILITLKDENKFLALNDTSAFTIMLQAPGQSQQQRIYFGQGLAFTPASLPKNSATILYSPILAQDGRYTLIAQAKDRSANASGQQDYRIQFEVNNKPSVTGVLNYPNPFTTSTRFVFTLTGSEIPEVFTIRIMTISGKVVREITRDELGFLHIGRNITEYAWDGRDSFGDRLANGVYLYHVITKLNGSNIEKSASGADKFFVKEYGKMVLMR